MNCEADICNCCSVVVLSLAAQLKVGAFIPTTRKVTAIDTTPSSRELVALQTAESAFTHLSSHSHSTYSSLAGFSLTGRLSAYSNHASQIGN